MKKSWKNASDAVARRGSGSGYSGPARSKAGAKSIRGRISEPIPIRSPLDEELRLKSTEIDVPPSKMKVVGETALSSETGETQAPSASPKAMLRQSRSPQGGSPARGKMPLDLTHDTEEGSVTAPTEPANPLRYSMISESTEVSRGSLGGPQRKNSTIRGAIGKLFNRKRRADNHDSPGSNVTPTSEAFDQLAGESVRISEPKMTDSSAQQFHSLGAKRRNSLPISEFDRALRSHSVKPKDITAIGGVRNSVNEDFTRSNASPNGGYIQSLPYLHTDDENLVGLSPRPDPHRSKAEPSISSHRSSQSQRRLNHEDSRDAQRRSKSVSGTISTNPQRRRRSDDRYWGESHRADTESHMSSIPIEETEIVSRRSEARDTPEQKPRSPVQPFIFGDIATMNEMAGMKITQAASIDTRIRTLEAKLQELEIAMGDLRAKIPQDRANATETTRERSISPKSTQVRLTDELVEPGQSRLPPLSSTSGNRPSTSTARTLGRPPSQSRHRSVTLTIDHYLTLVALIETERSSRQALEAQVRGMTRRMKELSRVSQDTTTLLTINPHHRSVIQTGEEKPETSAFDQDTSEEENEGMQRKFTVGQEDSGIGHIHDVRDNEKDDDGDDEFRDESKAIMADSDNYTRNLSGRELNDIDLDRGQDVRTLSLSQMTFEKQRIVNS